MKLSELIQQLKKAHDDMNTNAHPSLCDTISLIDQNGDLHEIDGEIEWNYNIGCRCTIGAIIRIKKED